MSKSGTDYVHTGKYIDIPQSESFQEQRLQYNDTIEDDASMIDLFSIDEHHYDQNLANLNTSHPSDTGSNLKSAFFNMTNSIVGAGIVGIPRAFMNSGLLAGLIMMVVLAFLNDWTLRLIVVNTKLSGTKSYTGFVTHSYGTFGKIVVLLAQGLFALGGTIGFTIIIGDSIPYVLRSIFHEAIENHKFIDQFILSRNSIIFFFMTLVAYPLCWISDISKLAKTSAMALFSMTIIVLIVVLRGPSVSSDYKGSIDFWGYIINGGIFQGISVISFALVCHHNTTFIYDSIKVPTIDRFNMVTHISCAISGFICTLMGVCGFLYFGDLTKGNILNNFPNNDWVINVARFCFGFNMITTIPLEVFVIKEVLKDLYNIYKKRKNPLFEFQSFTKSQTLMLTGLLIVFAEIVAMNTCNLGAVLELVGATSGSTLAYILPPLCRNKMTKENKSKLQQLPYYACATFGFLVMILSSGQTIMESFKHRGDANQC